MTDQIILIHERAGTVQWWQQPVRLVGILPRLVAGAARHARAALRRAAAAGPALQARRR